MSNPRIQLDKIQEQDNLIHVEPQQMSFENSSVMKLYNTHVGQSKSVVRSKWMKPAWLKKEAIPEETLSKQVKEAYKNAHDGEKIGFFEKPKAKKEARRKQGTMLKAAKVYKKFYEESAKETAPAEEMNSEFIKENKEALARDAKGLLYLIDGKEDKLSFYKTLKDGSNEDRVNAIKPLFDKFLNIEDFSRYNFKNDDELFRNFLTYRKEINAGFTLSKMVSQYKELGGELKGSDEAKLLAIAETLQAVSFTYEARLNLIQNPYYALLRDKTYAGKSSQELSTMAFDLRNADEADPTLIVYLEKLSDYRAIFEGEKDITGNYSFHGNDIDRIYKDALDKHTRKIIH